MTKLLKALVERLVWLDENDLNFLLDLQNVDYVEWKKRRLISTILFGVPVLVLCFTRSFVFLLIIYLIYKFPYYRLQKKYRDLQEALAYEFPIWLRQVQCLVQSYTVLNAIDISLKTAPNLLRSHLEAFLFDLKKEPLNYEAYDSFMSEYKLPIINRSMKNLYRYNLLDEDKVQVQVQSLTEETSQNLARQRQILLQKQIDSYRFLTYLPMLFVSALFILMMSLVFSAMMKGGG